MESSDSEDQERTRVSETDVDIAEEENLPYRSTGLREELSGTGGQSKGPGQDYSLVDPTLLREKPDGHPLAPSTTADDDALQLVRDIFFT